jgi:hypothetical protein
MQFEHAEDREFFAKLLAGGDEKRLQGEFSDYFDFRDAAIKRLEFNKIRKKVLAELIEKNGEVCQWHIHLECSREKIWELDHIIPLSTNELNKKLRGMVRVSNQKVPAQSFGSNHPKNLVLSCRRCNAFKKHRIFSPVAGLFRA